MLTRSVTSHLHHKSPLHRRCMRYKLDLKSSFVSLSPINKSEFRMRLEHSLREYVPAGQAAMHAPLDKLRVWLDTHARKHVSRRSIRRRREPTKKLLLSSSRFLRPSPCTERKRDLRKQMSTSRDPGEW